jgi:protoporphyrinogen oxidase
MHDIIIIGGGISGLYTFYKLKKERPEINILLLEKNPDLGGKIKTNRKFLNGIKYTIEQGAHRFNQNHKLILELIKELELDQYKKNINVKSIFVPSCDCKTTYQENINQICMEKILDFYEKNKSEDIKKYTFYEYAKKVLTPEELKLLVGSNGYYASIVCKNAKDQIMNYKINYNSILTFFTLTCGIDKIISKLKKIILDIGGNIQTNTSVENIDYNKNKEMFQIFTDSNVTYKCRQCILAIPKSELLKLNILTENYYTKTLLQSVATKQYCKIYYIFKKEDIPLLEKIKNTTTNNNLRHVFPIHPEDGSMLISYTDSKFAEYWKELNSQDPINYSVVKKHIKKNIYKTFGIVLPEPIDVNIFYWKFGNACWKKNVNSNEISQQILKPINSIPLYICSENYSMNQSWMEGALETSEHVVKKILQNM